MTTGISITINIPGLGDIAGTTAAGGITLDTGTAAPPPEMDDAVAADSIAEGDAPPPPSDLAGDADAADFSAPSPPAGGENADTVGDVDEPPPPGDASGDVSESDFAVDDGGEPPPPVDDIPETSPTAATKRAKGKRARRK